MLAPPGVSTTLPLPLAGGGIPTDDLRSVGPRHQRARGTGRISAKLRDGRAVLRELFQEGCAKIRLPHTHDHSLQAVLINTAGGLCGGDDVSWDAEAEPGTSLVLTTQACERVYRSLGPPAAVRTSLHAGEGARLLWVPQETIMFEGAHLQRQIDVELAGSTTLLAVEAVLLGRDAMGETARNARFADSWTVRRNGRPIHIEATRIVAEGTERDAPSLLAGANAFATLLYVGADAERRLDTVRPLLRDQTGASVTGDKLVVRFLSGSGLALRRHLIPILQALAGATALPRLWHM